MRYTILLDKNEKTQDIEVQEQARFVKSLLEALEVPIKWNPEEPFSIDSKIEFRKSLGAYNINIINDNDGGMKVFVKDNLIGEWFKCSYKLKKDSTQINPNKQLYLEMLVNFWTTFESGE